MQIAIEILHAKYEAERSQWEMLSFKSLRWIVKFCGEESREQIREAVLEAARLFVAGA